MINIPLTQGHFATVDDEDEHLALVKWGLHRDRSGNLYAVRTLPRNAEGKKPGLKLHRVVLGVTDPLVIIDHKDGNGLNCRRSNLRVSSRTQNARNRIKSPKSDQKSPYMGVTWHSRDKKFQAQIRYEGRTIYLGSFQNVEEANAARMEAEIRLWGLEPRRASASSIKINLDSQDN